MDGWIDGLLNIKDITNGVGTAHSEFKGHMLHPICFGLPVLNEQIAHK